MLLSHADSLCHCRYILSNVATGLKALPPPGEGYDDDLSDPSSEDVSAATRLDKVGSSRCWQGPGMWRAGLGTRHVQCGVMRQLFMAEAASWGVQCTAGAVSGDEQRGRRGRFSNSSLAWCNGASVAVKHVEVSCMIGRHLCA